MVRSFFTLLLFFSTYSIASTVFKHPYRVAITSFPATFDPAKTSDTDSSSVILQLFDTLFSRNSFDEISPALIESYQLSSDRMVYQFKLRPNIFFHNGNPIKSEDVVFTLTRAIKLGVLSDWNTEIIKDSNAYVSGKSKIVSGIKIESDKAFSVQLTRPWPRFLQILADVRMSVVPKGFSLAGTVIGSGPFKIKSVSDTEIVLVPFEKYWKPRSDGEISAILFKVVRNETLARKLLKEHELDNTHPFVIEPSVKDVFWKEYSYIHASVRFLGFNVEKPPFNNIEIRKALVSVLPFSEFHKELNAGKSFPVSHFIPYGLPGYVAEEWTPPLKLEAASKILKSIPWKKPIELVTYLPDQNVYSTCERICKVWESHGVACKILNVSLKEYIERESKGLNGVFVAKLMPHVPDTYQLLAYFRSDSAVKFFNLKDSSINRLLDQSLLTPNAQEVANLYEQVNRKIFSYVVAIPFLYMGKQKHYINKNFIMPHVDVSGPYFQRINEIHVRAGAGK